VAGTLMLAGCGSITIPLTGSSPPVPQTTASLATGAPALPALPSSLAYDTLGDADWEIVRKTVASSLFATADSRLEWRNDRTGTSGTLTDMTATRARNGAACRTFTTTMAKIDGVRLYRGEACQGYAGEWEIVSTAPVDVRG
jgi:surface antigen